MDVSTKGNGPSEDHPEVPSPLEVDATQNSNAPEKVTPEGMGRQVSTAYKEMDVIDTIIAQSRRSDLPQDYIQMNETLKQKRRFLVEWNIPYNANTNVLTELNSDHLPIIIDVEMSKPPHNFNTNWHDYNYHLQNTDLNSFTIDSKESADKAIKNFTNAMHTAHDKASKPKHFHSHIKLLPEIKSKIKERNRTRKLWQRTRDPTLKN
ncbi:hypothetical protein CEXT_9181 [Caerostris extrusa]|uniref:Uncharacterized protein n=1 Tax=Caerostris extrusa TaxID=172846 RepID=A0AAV4PS31_CAEEX|nr:hypothetical protein CEXT_9181 [Caerostris extrusa]